MKNYFLQVTAVLPTIFTICGCNPALTIMQPNIANGGRAVAVVRHPTSDAELLVASETGGMFKTTNGGSDWTQISGSSAFTFSDVKYDPSNPSTIIATAYPDSRTVNGGGIWRSTSGGSSWSQVTLPASPAGCSGDLSVNCIDVDPGSGRLWAGSSCGVLYSDDHGATWAWLSAASGYFNERVAALIVPVANHLKMLTDYNFLASDDNGSNWTPASSGLPYINPDVHNQIACSPMNDHHLFLAGNWGESDGWHTGLYKSVDNGVTWICLVDEPFIGRPTFTKTAHALNNNSNQFDLYFSDGGCLFERSTWSEGATPAMLGGWTPLVLDHCDGSDLAFKTDSKTPLLFTSDGGVSTTSDKGGHWAMTGAGSHGYNALQVTECTGQQHSGDSKSDLYFATQDNNIWGSPDEGATWPNNICCEGFFLNISRAPLSPGQTKITGVSCSGCGNFIADPILAGSGGWPGPPNDAGNPFMLVPANYVENTQVSGLSDNIFNLTTNTGGAWVPKYGFTEAVRDLSKLSPNGSNPVIFTAARMTGATSDGQEILGIKRITGVLAPGSPTVSTITGFGSLGTFPTMFAWYKPYGVDPFDQNHLIVPDIIDSVMKYTLDGGASWHVDTPLTQLVTGGGTYRFRWGGFTQLSNIGFDPDKKGHILVGTVQAGIFSTCDNGKTWSKIVNSELLPYVSSFYFDGNNSAIISTYGRGLWKYNYTACPTNNGPTVPQYVASEPLIWWKGGEVPISQIHDPEVCPVCGFFIMQAGDIAQYVVNAQTDVLESVTLTSGRIKGYSATGANLETPFATSIAADKQAALAGKGADQQLFEFMRVNNLQIKGLFLDGKMLKGFMLYNKDIQPEQLPRPSQPKPKVYVEWKAFQHADSGVTAFRLLATGLDRHSPVTIKLDGKVLKQDSVLTFDEKGNLAHQFRMPLKPGGHTVLIEQKGPDGKPYREAYTFVIPIGDAKHEK
ncbi:MAG TPA: sialidase family protein [Puia sp.]|nr:sialidase family protein [Puia sp.]